MCKWLPLYISHYMKQKQQIIRGSYLMHADEHTKVFINKIDL